MRPACWGVFVFPNVLLRGEDFLRKPRKVSNIRTCYGVIFLSWASTFLYTPTLPTFAASLGMSNISIGLISGGFGLMLALLRAPLGILSDKIGRRKLLINIGMMAAVICPLMMAVHPAGYSLMIYRFLSGIAPATWPVLTVLVSSYFDRSQSAAVIARCNLFNSLGNVAGMLAGGAIVAASGQVVAFYIAALVGVGAFVLSLFVPERKPVYAGHMELKHLLEALRHRRLVYFSVLAMIFQIIITGTSTSFTPIYAQSIGADSFQLGILGTLSMAGMGIASLLHSSLCRVLRGTRNLLALCFCVLACTTSAIVYCQSIFPLFLIQLLQGTSGYMTLILLMGECIAPYRAEERATAMGVFQSIFSLGMCIGPFLSGILYDWLSAEGVFLFLSTLAIAAFVAVALWYHRMDS